VLLEAVDEFVVRCRLAMDVDGRAEVVEDLIERSESGVVASAVDVSGLDVEDLLSESLGDELREAGLAGAAGAGDDGGIAGSLFVMGSRTLERWLTSASQCSISRGTNPARRTRASRIMRY